MLLTTQRVSVWEFFPLAATPLLSTWKALQVPWSNSTVRVYLPAEARPSNTWRRYRPGVWLADGFDRRRGLSSLLTNRRGALRHVETSAARPQIAGSKQSREESCAAAICCCEIPTLRYDGWNISQDFCSAWCSTAFLQKKRKKERKKKKEKNSPAWTTRTGTTEEKNKTKKQASSMLSLHHDSLKESDDIISSCFWKKSFLILHLLKTIFHQIIVGSICSLRDHVICNQGDIEFFLFLNRCEWQLIELSSQVHTLQWCINARFTIQLYPVRIIYIKLSFFPPDRVGGGTMTSS